MRKVLTLDDLLGAREAARAANRRVVQCHGCFDIVHPGHIRHLKQAKSRGDILLVSITADDVMRKGDGRPLIPEELRAENLAELDCVDWVYIDRHETAADLLEQVRPDIYVKGREYEFNADPRFRAEREAVERHGGRVVFSSGDVVFSSTALISTLERSIDPYHGRLTQLLAEPELQGPELMGVISAFRNQRAVVVGEVITDTYVLCDRPDVAGESPVMTLRPIERRSYDGGAAVIARHLAAMGARPILVTALPNTTDAAALRGRLAADGVEIRSIETDQPIPEKQRFLVGVQKVMKVDLVDPFVLDARQQRQLVALAAEAAGPLEFDPRRAHKETIDSPTGAAIVANFGLGLLSGSLLQRLCRRLRPLVRTLTGDVSGRRSSLDQFRNLDLLCPSEQELRDALGSYEESLPGVVWSLIKRTGARSIAVTMGAEGLIAFKPLPDADSDGDGFRSRLHAEHVPALSAHAVDPLGCGDALLAASTLTLAAGGSLLAASMLGSIAAAAQASRLGNTVISATDLRQGVVRLHASHLTLAAPRGFEPRATPHFNPGAIAT